MLLPNPTVVHDNSSSLSRCDEALGFLDSLTLILLMRKCQHLATQDYSTTGNSLSIVQGEKVLRREGNPPKLLLTDV